MSALDYSNHRYTGGLVLRHRSMAIVTQIVTDIVGVPAGPCQQMLQPIGVVSPRCSAMVQQFLRSKPETIPAMSSPAWRNGWCRAKRGAIRSSTAENSACHRSGSTL
ncbi:hypothetical protein GS11_1249 [Mycobacterium tuberculosis variant bovis BCG]|uniref:Uncharacterized protein n=7 Tax=Mycobacterium tuberculosis complex TaxID=77643 RepID=R4LWJ3_MYCTX|nr:hypothetical protein MRGA423_07160 [Mycobacterium tuberculosis RGTB423]AGJ67191.1 hypothetical protein J112_06190 [Mycobacterium tuberculosis str. Beijing/NITR203]AGL22860.1 hypothetical protein I917_08140 [Mycobacterium tuberculosis str. Haarlem/NITR202]AGL30609.1 hypothetical protein J114_06190 [Mycobacterium tuberculosis EAI5/NITR206]AKO24175.1 hypothetical protein GS11_1249 [Mycobacterium tuberculosis variant bovis BCG]